MSKKRGGGWESPSLQWIHEVRARLARAQGPIASLRPATLAETRKLARKLGLSNVRFAEEGWPGRRGKTPPRPFGEVLRERFVHDRSTRDDNLHKYPREAKKRARAAR